MLPRLALAVTVAVVALSVTAYAAQGPASSRDPVIASSPPRWVEPPAPPAPPPSVTPAAGSLSPRPQVDPEWAGRVAGLAGISVTAVVAYARASLLAPASCSLGWTTLAGIGWVESQHATIGGRTLGADGRASTPILGPVLDGAGDVAAVPATDALGWDRAAGPMQFISSTWVDWHADGDGDGVEDVQDLDDAAYAAARYLCADGHDLATAQGWTDAVLSYNHAQAYLDAVHAAAAAYADRVA